MPEPFQDQVSKAKTKLRKQVYLMIIIGFVLAVVSFLALMGPIQTPQEAVKETQKRYLEKKTHSTTTTTTILKAEEGYHYCFCFGLLNPKFLAIPFDTTEEELIKVTQGATIHGYERRFCSESASEEIGFGSVLTLWDAPTSSEPGILMKITDEQLRIFDEIEQEGKNYVRKREVVETKKGEKVEAWFYEMLDKDGEAFDKFIYPSPVYVELVESTLNLHYDLEPKTERDYELQIVACHPEE